MKRFFLQSRIIHIFLLPHPTGLGSVSSFYFFPLFNSILLTLRLSECSVQAVPGNSKCPQEGEGLSFSLPEKNQPNKQTNNNNKTHTKKPNPKLCRPLEAANPDWWDPPAWGRGSGSRPAPFLPINQGTSSPKLAGLNETARDGVQAMRPQSYRSLPECGPYILWAII